MNALDIALLALIIACGAIASFISLYRRNAMAFQNMDAFRQRLWKDESEGLPEDGLRKLAYFHFENSLYKVNGGLLSTNLIVSIAIFFLSLCDMGIINLPRPEVFQLEIIVSILTSLATCGWWILIYVEKDAIRARQYRAFCRTGFAHRQLDLSAFTNILGCILILYPASRIAAIMFPFYCLSLISIYSMWQWKAPEHRRTIDRKSTRLNSSH